MKEIGGYIELDNYSLPMMHEEGLKLNCGRNCLRYLIRAKNIKKIALPYFFCDSVINVCLEEKIEVIYYNINEYFYPHEIVIDDETWLYLVNFYGQLSIEYIKELSKIYSNKLIIDNAQAYFELPVKNVDTIYTCRKFFGVPDGGILFTNCFLNREIQIDQSYDRMLFLLGRYEKSANEFYKQYVENNKKFSTVPMKKMSKLTNNLLHAIDYEKVKKIRTQNYLFLFNELKSINKLDLKMIKGAFAYPLWVKNGNKIRQDLAKKKIYIPLLWPNVLDNVNNNSLEYEFAQNILPIPCDQRYNIEDMRYICEEIKKMIFEKEDDKND